MMWAESLLDTVSVLPDPEREPITEIEQHVLWPLEPSHRPRFEALLASTQTVRLREEPPPRANTPLDHIEVCAARLAHLGLDAIAIDVTSPDIAEVGFHVARVVAPGTQPLFFGSGLHRLSPRALATSENLNLHPHPFP